MEKARTFLKGNAKGNHVEAEDFDEVQLWMKFVKIYALALVVQITITIILVSLLCHKAYFDNSRYNNVYGCACPENDISNWTVSLSQLRTAWCYLPASQDGDKPCDCSPFASQPNMTFDTLLTYLNRTHCLIPDPPETKVTSVHNKNETFVTVLCLVSGFFPKDIQVTWQRDGKNISDEVQNSNLSQNEDNTFRIQKSIAISPDDKSVYTCRIKHEKSGLGKVITYIPQRDEFLPLKLSVGFAIVAGVVIFLVISIFCCKM
ncbi:uncharacterized protein [Ambystoma mexicanum]|uniref:uncharacterized protein n=1 Tax=Ambystoma mexicanum TaxID=8296 RepID=UPI0037E7402C